MYLCEFEVTLNEVVDPAVRRKFLIPDSVSMKTLHRVIQTAFGWRDCHNYSFYADNGKTEVTEDTAEFGWGTPEGTPKVQWAHETNVSEFFMKQCDNKVATYVYDFGDDWAHTVRLVRRHRAKADEFGFHLLDGEGQCPPDDVGGVPRFYRFRKLLSVLPSELSQEEQDERRDWAQWYGLREGETFDPCYFNRYDVQTRLYHLQHYQTRPFTW